MKKFRKLMDFQYYKKSVYTSSFISSQLKNTFIYDVLTLVKFHFIFSILKLRLKVVVTKKSSKLRENWLAWLKWFNFFVHSFSPSYWKLSTLIHMFIGLLFLLFYFSAIFLPIHVVEVEVLLNSTGYFLP